MNAADQITRCSELAAATAQWLGRGIVLSEEARHFLESTFGCFSDQEVVDILQDDTHPESESILELLFSPSFDLRWRLEPLLESYPYESKDTDCLVNCFLEQVKELPVEVGPSRLRALMPVSEESIRHFLRRLQFHKRLDAGTAQRIEELFEASAARWYKTLLRQARCSLNEARRAFLLDFLDRFQDHRQLERLFRFVLHFFEETPLDEDIQQALLRKRMLLEHTLKRSRQIQHQIKTHAVETLIMQRVNVLHIDEEEVRGELRCIDEICWQMFGHLPPASGPETEISLSWNPREDAFQQVFSRFSDLD